MTHDPIIKYAVSAIGLLFSLWAVAVPADELDALVFDDNPKLRDIRHPPWFKTSFLDLKDDLEEAVTAGKRGIMIYFGQENCAYCEALIEVNFGQPDIAEYTQRNFDVIEIDIWGSREITDLNGDTYSEHAYSVKRKTTFTPTILFVDGKQQLAMRLRGYHPPYRFRAALEFVAGGHYENETFRAYLERADPPPKFEIGDLNNQDFFLPPPHMLDRSRIRAQRPLLVFFEQRDCHACDILHTDPVADPKVQSLLRRFDVAQVDMWSEDPIITPDGSRIPIVEWSRKLGLFYAPTLMFFDETGREVFRVASVIHVYRLGRVLEYVAERGYETGLTYLQWHGRRRFQQTSRLD